MADQTSVFAAAAVALYAAHHVGDYWVQTDHQARHKGDAGREGARQCLAHVGSYLLTQVLALAAVTAVTDMDTSPLGVALALIVSGVTHYLADRRERGIMLKLARALPGKAAFVKLGAPRNARALGWVDAKAGDQAVPVALDNPCLGTGAWALDQAWHIFWGVFVAALLIAGLS